MIPYDRTLKNFVNDGSERSVQDIISKLKFISKIKNGEVVDVQSLKMMEKNSWSTSFYRTLIARGESRDMTLEFFRRVIADAFSLATFYINADAEFFQSIGRIILESLDECKVGILNHIKTYESDRMHTSKVETLLKTLDAKKYELHSASRGELIMVEEVDELRNVFACSKSPDDDFCE